MRFFFVDRITYLEHGTRISGFKNVAMSEPFFATHFIRYPVLPGVLIVEALAQLAGLLIETSIDGLNAHKKAILSIVDRVKFKRMVRPGDRLDLDARLVIFDEDGARAEVEARCEGGLVAKTRLTFALLPVPEQFADLIRREREALLHALKHD